MVCEAVVTESNDVSQGLLPLNAVVASGLRRHGWPEGLRCRCVVGEGYLCVPQRQWATICDLSVTQI